jgi:hypothetical protein
MTRIPKWTWLVAMAMLVAFAGCAANDDDDDDNGGATIGGEGDSNGDDDDASGEARGSPGWGLIGSIGAVGAVGYLVRKRLQ